jgi:FkbM family methyltransferase
MLWWLHYGQSMPETEFQIINRDYSKPLRGAYGDLRVLSSYVGLPKIPKYTLGELPHGWIMKERNITPDFVIGSDGLGYQRKEDRLFVARTDQESYLRKEGFIDVHAIGHPIVYVNDRCQSRRIKNSLLVMPAHSLPETTEDWRQSDIDYCEALIDHLSKFDFVSLCLHPSDLKKGSWTKLMELIPNVIEGADPEDHNSYYRMRDLFTTFEFVTGNTLGSHIAYASYFGAKTSVYGPVPMFRKADYKNLIFYKNQPDILEILEIWEKNNFLLKCYPDLFCDPDKAVYRNEWAEKELGLDCKKSVLELRKLLGWTPRLKLKFFIGSKLYPLIRKIYKKTIQTGLNIKILINFCFIFGFLESVRNYYQLASSQTNESVLNFKKKKITFRPGSSDVNVCIQHFGRRELLDINYPKKIQSILDLGANIGISVLIFRDMFPDAQIIAVEMNADNFELLSKNVAGDGNVSLVNGAVWSEAGWVNQIDPGEGDWALRVGDHLGLTLGKVPAYTFDQLLKMHHINHLDVCKMDIEGAEKEVLESSWRDIFKVTKLLIVEVHDWIPGCTETVDRILEESGDVFNLKISKSGEFTLIENQDL